MGKLTSWSYDMKGRAEPCVKRYCEVAHKSVEQLIKKFLHAVSMILIFTMADFEMVGDLATVCAQLVFQCPVPRTIRSTRRPVDSHCTGSSCPDMEQSV